MPTVPMRKLDNTLRSFSVSVGSSVFLAGMEDRALEAASAFATDLTRSVYLLSVGE